MVSWCGGEKNRKNLKIGVDIGLPIWYHASTEEVRKMKEITMTSTEIELMIAFWEKYGEEADLSIDEYWTKVWKTIAKGGTLTEALTKPFADIL